MWTVEINVLGRRFTHTSSHVAGDRPDLSVRTPRMTHWRQWKQRHPRAAA